MSLGTLKGGTVDVQLWAALGDVESQALDQLRNIASLPWVFHHVAAMADVHLGKGATVGSVIAMKHAVAPSAVGVDIGCGMAALKTSLTASQLPDDLKALRLELEAAIPVGFSMHERPVWHRWEDLKRDAENTLWKHFDTLAPEAQGLHGRAQRQLGTLGGGNHFLELCLDSSAEPGVWLMLHSGSRNIGKELAEVHIAIARKLAHNQLLPDRDLAVFLSGTRQMDEYRRDLYWAQHYARLNRRVMLRLYREVLERHLPAFTVEEEVHCHHNYVAEETHFGEAVFVTRKGAIRAGLGEKGIIPGSMGTRSYIVSGLGNPESFESASHGAGRAMSRGAAKRRFTEADLVAQTAGVECRKDRGVLDEIPGAYKKIEAVMENQRDLVKIDAELKAVLCIKG